MQRRRVDSHLERQLLIALLTSKPFLASAVPVLDVELLQTEYVRLVARWCVDYFKAYGKAPGRNIEPVFHAWSEQEARDESQISSIEALLGGLSEESDKSDGLNVPYLLDELGRHLSTRKLARLNENLTAYLLQGNREAALEEVHGFSAVDLGQGVGFAPLNDRSVWTRAFDDPVAPLFTFGGAAGAFLDRAMTRDALIAIQAPEKRGKTMQCVEFTMRALRARRRVALFEVGDLSESQIVRRLGVRLTGLPMYDDQCKLVRIPKSLKKRPPLDDGSGNDPGVDVDYDDRTFRRPVSREASIYAARDFVRAVGMSKGIPYLMTSVHPNSSISVRGIDGILDRWQHEQGFVPDVIVIDYADILQPEDSRKEARNQVDETWRGLRRLSQERHCLVVSPTQAKAASYDAKTQGMKHFSEDKRKLAHVTGVLGLNQTPDEKIQQVMRLNWIVLREAEFASQRCLYVGQCFALARAVCCSVV